MEKISENINYSEAIKSQSAERLGLNNTPTAIELVNMRRVAKVFEQIRRDVCENKPLFVSSFFRSKDVNSAIGGSTSSQHCKGEAMDIDADVFGHGSNKEIFDYIRENIEFDQLISEFGTEDSPAWIHVSLKVGDNRRQVLRAFKKDGRTRYEHID